MGVLVMKTFLHGSYFSVRVSRTEVNAFRYSGAAGGLPHAAVEFYFDTATGHLLASRGTDDCRSLATLSLADEAQRAGMRVLEALP